MLPQPRFGRFPIPMDHEEVHAMLLGARGRSPGAFEDSAPAFQSPLGPIEGYYPHSHQSKIFVFLLRATENPLRMNLLNVSCD
jgi:hypothetical protein